MPERDLRTPVTSADLLSQPWTILANVNSELMRARSRLVKKLIGKQITVSDNTLTIQSIDGKYATCLTETGDLISMKLEEPFLHTLCGGD